MYKNKEVKIILSEEANSVYDQLNQIVGEEKKNKVGSSFHQTLLKANPFAGDQVQKDRIPKKYIQMYGAENIWGIELADRWRLVYTIQGNQIEIITFVMSIFNHRDYDKIFGYKH